MKIEKIETYLVRDLFLVEVTTDNGITGLGQSACWGFPEAVSAIVQKMIPLLLSQDPTHTEHISQLLYRSSPFKGSVLSGALSAIDIALWDIKAKSFQCPVWELLGGKVRDKVRLHLLLGGFDNQLPKEEGIYGAAKKAVEQGFTALKIDPLPDNYFDLSLDKLVKLRIMLVH